MPTRKVTVLDRQSLVDIALQEHGSLEALFTVVDDDPTIESVTEPIVAGQLIKVTSKALDAEPPALYLRTRQFPVTGDVLPMFMCSGPGYHGWFALDMSTLFIQSSTGYVTTRHGAQVIVTGDGNPSSIFEVGGGIGAWCVWSSDAYGNVSGSITTAQHVDAASSYYLQGMPQATDLTLSAGANMSIDLRGTPALGVVIINGGPYVKHIFLDPDNNIYQLNATGCDIDNTDEVVNRMNASIPNGTLILDGGGAVARTSASDVQYNRLVTGAPMTISGAGSSTVNGSTYALTTPLNGRDRYTKTGVFVFWNGTHWRIQTGGGDIYEGLEDVLQPWLVTTWIAIGGTPTPVPSSVTQPFPGGWTVNTN